MDDEIADLNVDDTILVFTILDTCFFHGLIKAVIHRGLDQITDDTLDEIADAIGNDDTDRGGDDVMLVDELNEFLGKSFHVHLGYWQLRDFILARRGFHSVRMTFFTLQIRL